MSCCHYSVVLYQQVVSLMVTVGFFSLPLLSYKNTGESFSGAERAVVVDGDGAGCRAALYESGILIVALNH